MLRSWSVAWFVRSRRQAYALGKMTSNGRMVIWVAVLVVLAAMTFLVGRAQADAIDVIRPVVEIDAGTPVVEGGAAFTVVDVTLSNPSPTAALTVLDLLVALNIPTGDPDRTDRLTLNGTRVSFAGCRGLNIPAAGVKGLGGVTLGPAGTGSDVCMDVIIIPAFDAGLADEGTDVRGPDSGTSTVNVSAVTPAGIHSQIETADVEVEDPPRVREPSTLLTLGSGLLALASMLGWNIRKGTSRWRITKITQQSAFGISLDNASAIDNN